MKKTVLVLVVILVGLRLAASAIRSRSGFSGSPEEKLAQLRKVASDANKELPVTANGATLTKIEAERSGLVLHYRVNEMRFVGGQDTLARPLRDIACANDAFLRIMKAGFNIKLAVENQAGVSLGSYTFHQGHCLAARRRG